MKGAFAACAALLGGCVTVSNDGAKQPSRFIGVFQPRIGTGYVSDTSEGFPSGRRESIGANLAWLYRFQPQLAIGIGLDSTVLKGVETADGAAVDYNSYGGAFETRFDSGSFFAMTYFAYYFGERALEFPFGDKVPLRGPGAGFAFAYRIGGRESGHSLDVGPYINFFQQRVGDEGDRIRNFSTGIMIGVTLGGPPTGDVDERTAPQDPPPPPPSTAPPSMTPPQQPLPPVTP